MHDPQLLWTVLGRGPAIATLLFLTWSASRVQGWAPAVLGLSGFVAGAMLGLVVLPSILGALLGGVAGAIATWKVLDAALPPPDTAAFTLIALMMVGRWGCLLGGCCFGTPSTAPWALHYAAGSIPQRVHASLGLVDANAPSLGVVPVQLLESLGLLAILLVGWGVRRRLTRLSLSLHLTAAVFLLRAALDPMRAMLNTASSVVALGPITLFQAVMLGSALACVTAAIVVRHETAQRPATPTVNWKHAAVVWGAQTCGALAAEGHAIWLLRVLACLTLATSALVLFQLLPSAYVNRRPVALALTAALLLPLLSRAGDTGLSPPGRGWTYEIDAASGKLVRQPIDRQRIDDAFKGPQTVTTLSVTGGTQGFLVRTCAGESTLQLPFGELAWQHEMRGTAQNVTMLRARLMIGDGGTASGITSALYDFVWDGVTVGLGLSLSVSTPFASLKPFMLEPGGLGRGFNLGLLPLVYFAVRPTPSLEFELGTASRFQPQEGPFVGMHLSFPSARGRWGLRGGLEAVWLPWPLANLNGFVDLGIPWSETVRLHLRVSGHPGTGGPFALTGGIRLSWGW